MNQNEIFELLRNTLVDEFEVDAGHIVMDARLNEDLDLDSIDAVDLVVRLQQVTKKKIKPDDFKEVRTVGDVVSSVEKLFA